MAHAPRWQQCFTVPNLDSFTNYIACYATAAEVEELALQGDVQGGPGLIKFKFTAIATHLDRKAQQPRTQRALPIGSGPCITTPLTCQHNATSDDQDQSQIMGAA